MIKTVQVEERRTICDICNDEYFVMHGSTDTKKEVWVHIDKFSTTNKSLDVCPRCAALLKNNLNTFYAKSFSE